MGPESFPVQTAWFTSATPSLSHHPVKTLKFP
jgi:hypothetical protein